MKYAVAVTLTKPIPGGSNIVTHLNIYEAVSDAEARGLAFTAASDANPEHEVFSIAIVPVETQPQALSEERPWRFGYSDGVPGTPEYEPPPRICNRCDKLATRCQCFATETQKGGGE